MKIIKYLFYFIWSALTIGLMLYAFNLKIHADSELDNCQKLYENCSAELQELKQKQ